MKNRWHIAPIFMALLFLLGHQLFPHLHHMESDEQSVYAVEAVELDWLGRIFGLDQGADHLEHFRKSNTQPRQPLLGDFMLQTTWPSLASSAAALVGFVAFAEGEVPIPGDVDYAVGVQRGPPQG